MDLVIGFFALFGFLCSIIAMIAWIDNRWPRKRVPMAMKEEREVWQEARRGDPPVPPRRWIH